MIRRADSSLCMQKRSTSASTPRKNPRASLYRGYDRDEIRPFTRIVLTPCRRHARSRFGQISVSIMMNSRGFTRRSVRFTNGGRSNGRKNTASVSGSRVLATCWPLKVVVDRKMRRPGYRWRSSGKSARAVSTSPTETAWIQIDSSPSMLKLTGR